ncbi:ABC transporter permease [Moorella naiadis]|uniref:ABC transporter permease n=1 Tax=Moorella naiadis (nom. illeg.) TaxID=3093670 RepID=UPI003D9CA567
MINSFFVKKKEMYLENWRLENWRAEISVGLSLVLIFLLLSIISPYFFTKGNLLNIIYQVSTLGIIAVGQTMVIITAGIDLSVGSVFALSGMLMGMAMVKFGFYIGILVGLFIGFSVGLINGLLISYLRLAPFIVTLGMMSIAHSLTYVISNAKSVLGLPPMLERFGNTVFIGIPLYVFVTFILFSLGQLFLSYTKTGRLLYAVGSNESTARYSGVNVNLYKCLPYIFTGLLVAFSAFIQASHLLAIDPDAGTGLELDSIAAVVIGGTSLFGGKGSMVGTFIGICMMGILRNGLNLLGVSPYWQGTAVGAIIILAIAVERLSYKNK